MLVLAVSEAQQQPASGQERHWSRRYGGMRHYLDYIVCNVQLLHLCHEGGMHLVKHERLLRQLLADVLRPNEDVLKVHPVPLHLQDPGV